MSNIIDIKRLKEQRLKNNQALIHALRHFEEEMAESIDKSYNKLMLSTVLTFAALFIVLITGLYIIRVRSESQMTKAFEKIGEVQDDTK